MWNEDEITYNQPKSVPRRMRDKRKKLQIQATKAMEKFYGGFPIVEQHSGLHLPYLIGFHNDNPER